MYDVSSQTCIQLPKLQLDPRRSNKNYYPIVRPAHVNECYMLSQYILLQISLCTISKQLHTSFSFDGQPYFKLRLRYFQL